MKLQELIEDFTSNKTQGFVPFTEPKPKDSEHIAQLKAQLGHKIRRLPNDEATLTVLKKLEDLLSSMGSGVMAHEIDQEIALINDPDVKKAQKLLAKYFVGLTASGQYKKKLLNSWRRDELVNVKLLTTPGSHTVSELITGYAENPAVREFVNDLMQIDFQGQGKGEFMLSVLSPRINKLTKGDLNIQDYGRVEVKTRTIKGARFYDREVKPSRNYHSRVAVFLKSFAEEIQSLGLQVKSGINLSSLIALQRTLQGNRSKEFQGLLKQILNSVFQGDPGGVPQILEAIAGGREGAAKQAYARTSLANYQAIKKDKGILMIDLTTDPYRFDYFTTVDTLAAAGLRLHASTAYPIADQIADIYPQIHLVATGTQ